MYTLFMPFGAHGTVPSSDSDRVGLGRRSSWHWPSAHAWADSVTKKEGSTVLSRFSALSRGVKL